jgi:hypothetical protein
VRNPNSFPRKNQARGFRGAIKEVRYVAKQTAICFLSNLKLSLAIEEGAAERDARRTAWLVERGYRVIRFRNHEADEDVRLLVDKIREALALALPTPLHPPSLVLPSKGREPEDQE